MTYINSEFRFTFYLILIFSIVTIGIIIYYVKNIKTTKWNIFKIIILIVLLLFIWYLFYLFCTSVNTNPFSSYGRFKLLMTDN